VTENNDFVLATSMLIDWSVIDEMIKVGKARREWRSGLRSSTQRGSDLDWHAHLVDMIQPESTSERSIHAESRFVVAIIQCNLFLLYVECLMSCWVYFQDVKPLFPGILHQLFNVVHYICLFYPFMCLACCQSFGYLFNCSEHHVIATKCLDNVRKIFFFPLQQKASEI